MSRASRNLLAVFPSLVATSMGLMAFLPTIGLYVEERFAIHDPAELTLWTSIIYAMAPLSAGIAGPIWGALGDRVGKRPMAIRANLAIAATTALMPLAPSPLALLLLRIVQGAFAGYVAPAMALVSTDVPRAQQGRVIALMQVGMAIGSGLGPLLGAEVASAYGREALFFVTSAFALLAAVPLWLFAVEDPPTQRPELSFVRDLWSSSLLLLQNRVFALLLALVLLLRLGQNMFEPFVALFIDQLGAVDFVRAWTDDADLALERTVGIAFSVVAVAQVVFTPLWGALADRFGPLRCLAILGLLLSALLVGSALVADSGQYLLLRSLTACVMAGSMTLAYAAASKRVVAARRNLAFAMVQSCMQFGFAFGPMFGAGIARIGASAEQANLRLAYVVAGALCAAAGIGMFLLRRLPAGREGEVLALAPERE